MQKLLIVALLIGAVSCNFLPKASLTEFEKGFQSWAVENQRTYSNFQEYTMRFKVFMDAYRFIMEENSKGHTHTLGLNKFADLTPAEWKSLYTNPIDKSNAQNKTNLVVLPEVELKPSVDWNTLGAVTPVKNQLQCGSCWSFSTTGALEGLNFITNHNLLSFSEQQLVSCNTQNHGCNGGSMDRAFEYVADNSITLEGDYPYVSGGGNVPACNYNQSQGVFRNVSYNDVTYGSESQLEQALQIQPVSIAIEANQPEFQYYTSGVITSDCGDSLDHGVLAVGYGEENGQAYWLVKNSWGPTWGDHGFLKIGRGFSPAMCGIDQMASYPTME